MLRGHVFKSQTFANEAFGLFIDTFLQGNMGVIRGCELFNTNNTVTIGEGYFDVKGRFLQILGNETVTITDNGYYSLVCEIDLTKENTTEDFLQGEIKAIKGVSSYPTLTQQDINTNGTMYQYEFARFQVSGGNITNFTDTRTFVDFTSIYDAIENESQALIDEIEEALQDVLDGSSYVLKGDFAVLEGNIRINTDTQEGNTQIQLPTGWREGNTKILNISSIINGNYWKIGNAVFGFSADYSSSSTSNYITVKTVKLSGNTSVTDTTDIKVLVMKMD